MSPGGTDASLLELTVGFFVAASLVAVITMILRGRRSGGQDLMGTQVRDMEARAAAPGATTRLRDAATHIADARRQDAISGAQGRDALTSDASAAPPGAGSADVGAGDRPAPEAVSGGTHDTMADAFAWLRIAALVDAGQREQAVELLSTTMAISADEAALLVDGLRDAGGERQPG